MEIQKVYVKTRAEFGKQCIFDIKGPILDVDIPPTPSDMNDYIVKTHRHMGTQNSKQFSSHEVQTLSKTTKSTGMYHFEGGWPKEINPRDEETVARFRRRVEKDDSWAPKLRKLFELMEPSVHQNGAINIYQNYFDDIVPTELVQSLDLRTVNVYTDPESLKRPVTDISFSPDSGSRIAVSYSFRERTQHHDYSNKVYIWQVDNPNEPYMSMEAFCQSVVSEFNPRDPLVLASGLMSGQVCNWDLRIGLKPVLCSHLLLSHRAYANSLRWLPTKSNTEFFSASSDGRAMWWDTRLLKGPVESLMFDFDNPNQPNIDHSIGVSCLNYGPMIGAKFVFGMDNGVVVMGSRRMKTNAEKLAVKYDAHFGPVTSVDRNVFNPMVFLTVGDWTARIWAEDTREGCLVSTYYLERPTGGCWNKTRCSVFYVITASGHVLAYDLLQNLELPIFKMKLCNESLSTMAPHEEGTFLAVGSRGGKVYLIESSDFFQSFEKKERAALSEYLERRSKVMKAVDARLKEIKLVQKIAASEENAMELKDKDKKKAKKAAKKKPAKGSELEPRRSKERTRSLTKEKKKRDDSPELVEAEKKYYDMVQKGLDEYATESDPNLQPAPLVTQVSKKDKKQRRSSDVEPEEPESGKKQKQKGKSKFDDENRKRRIKKSKPSTEPSALADGEPGEISPTASLSGLDGKGLGKKAKKTRKTKVSFTYPVPCKGEVCEPKVCCWDVGQRARERSRSRSRSTSRTRSRSTSISKSMLDFREEKKDSVQWTTVKPSKARGKKKNILKEMMKPPSALTMAVRRARAEISEATITSRVLKTRTIKVSKIRNGTKVMQEDQQPKGGRKRVVKKIRYSRVIEEKKLEKEEKEENEGERVGTEERAADEMEGEGGGEPDKSVDTCKIPHVKSITDEFSSMLCKSKIKSMEEKTDEKTKSDKSEHYRGRVYPRISEYQGSMD